MNLEFVITEAENGFVLTYNYGEEKAEYHICKNMQEVFDYIILVFWEKKRRIIRIDATSFVKLAKKTDENLAIATEKMQEKEKTKARGG